MSFVIPNLSAARLPPPGAPRYWSLDAWRGIACLMVIVYHSTLFVGRETIFSASEVGSWLITAMERLWIGVPLFFVISGYCISATADAHRRGETARLATYFQRRFRRIFPPYWAAFGLLLVTCLMVMQISPELLQVEHDPLVPPWELTGWQWFGNLTLTETWLGESFSAQQVMPLSQGWTLCYEEQFYALAGLLLAVAPKRFFEGAVVITLLTLPWFDSRVGMGFFFGGYWLMFAAGMLVYHALNYQNRWQVLASCLVLASGAAFAAYPLSRIVRQDGNNMYQGLFVACLFGILLVVLKPWDHSLATHRFVRPLMRCGTMCYSLYLIHWPLTKLLSYWLYHLGFTSSLATALVTVPLCILASLLTGWNFFQLVERHFVNPSFVGSPADQTRFARNSASE